MSAFRKYSKEEMAEEALSCGARPYIALKIGRGVWVIKDMLMNVVGQAKRRKSAEALRDHMIEEFWDKRNASSKVRGRAVATDAESPCPDDPWGCVIAEGAVDDVPE